MASVAVGLLGGAWFGGSAVAATTTYSGTTGAFTINPTETALLIDGADITGNVTNNGTLEFGLTTGLVVSSTTTISGIGDVLLSASGTVTFSGSNSYLAGTTVRYGELVITSGGAISHTGTHSDMIVGSVEGDVGTLSILGGRVTNYDGVLGSGTGSTGNAFVTSGTWANTNDLTVGYSGTGAITISGGSVTVAGSAILGRDETAYGGLVVSGGSMTVGSVLNVGQGGGGRLEVNGGSVVNVGSYIGANFGSSGTATVTSGTWLNSGNMIVGFGGGVGELNISGDGVVVVGGILSRDAATGTINLDTGGTLMIGTGTTSGALDTDLTNNGTLIFDRSDFSQYYLHTISGTGVVIKRGAGTLEFSGSNSYSGGTDILGGRIDVVFGGAINHPSATLAIGDAGGAIGGLGVSGGYVNSSLLDLSNGDVSVSLGGVLESGTARIGLYGTGTATIGGGLWNVDSLYVGYSGTGTMNVTDGTVTSSEAVLGMFADDSGSATVTSTGVWNSYGNLTVGGSGTGVLSIGGGGSVLVTGTLSKGTYGTINLDAGGTLRIGDGHTTGVLATNLTNDGLLVFNRSNAYTYGGTIDGTGAVTKSGSGTLTFSGSSSYSGITTIEAGSFYIDGQLGNTSVVVNPGAFIGGNGTVLGSVTVGDVSGTAVLSPGSLSDAYGTLHLGSLSLMAGSLTRMSISGTQAGVDYDQIAAIGDTPTLEYGGDLELTLSGSYADYTTFSLFHNFTPTEGSNFNSIALQATDGPYAALSGLFTYDSTAGVWVTSWTSSRQRLEFSTVTGDLIVVPEPSTLVMGAAGVGFAALLHRRRRRRRAARLVSGRATDHTTEQPPDQA